MNDSTGFLVAIVVTWFLTWLLVEPRVYPQSVEFAEAACESNGGWGHIQEGRWENASVKCKNGAEFKYKWTSLKGGDK